MELLLINHPLDCPICDKGGECPLQNQAMTSGRTDSRFLETKRTFAKPLPISTQVLLDRERCVLCQRCTRFSEEIAGDPFIDLLERGAEQQIGVAQDKPFQSYFSGNTIQICPVGALTSAAYRFRSRPFDLVSTPSVCEHCASRLARCAPTTRRGTVLRRLAGNDPEVNEEWICDKSRFAFRYLSSAGPDHPAAGARRGRRAAGGVLDRGAAGGREGAARGPGARHRGAGRRPADRRGRLRLRASSPGSPPAPTTSTSGPARTRRRSWTSWPRTSSAPARSTLSYTALEAAPAVLCVALEPEEEAPVVFLRLRKAARKHRQQVFHLGQWSSPGGAAHRAGARCRRAGRPGQPGSRGARRRSGGVG